MSVYSPSPFPAKLYVTLVVLAAQAALASNAAAAMMAKIPLAESKIRLIPIAPPRKDFFGLKTGYVTGSGVTLYHRNPAKALS